MDDMRLDPASNEPARKPEAVASNTAWVSVGTDRESVASERVLAKSRKLALFEFWWS
jgi:hypothetical protein